MVERNHVFVADDLEKRLLSEKENEYGFSKRSVGILKNRTKFLAVAADYDAGGVWGS